MTKSRFPLLLTSLFTVAILALGLFTAPSLAAWAENGDSVSPTPMLEDDEASDASGLTPAPQEPASDEQDSDAGAEEVPFEEPQDIKELAEDAGVALLNTPEDVGTLSLPGTSTVQTIPEGALIIGFGGGGDFAGSRQNQLRPYGFVQDLLINYKVPVLWVIADGKSADSSVDFSATTVRLKPSVPAATTRNYSTGAFIVMPEYVPFIQNAINTWGGSTTSNGIVIDRATAAFDAPVYGKVQGWPRTVLDYQNGHLAGAYYNNAGIGYNAANTNPNNIDYRKPYFKAPSALVSCDDLYVMPHADPTVAGHSNLLPFNERGGYIWGGCHAVSKLENMSGTTGGVTYPLGSFSFLSTNGLVPFDKHGDGSPPYDSTSDRSDPIMQFWGKIDGASQNGSEQIYLPSRTSSWRGTSKVLTWDPTQANVPSLSAGPAAAMVYGRGFGDPTNGMVMYQGGHRLDNSGTAAEQNAAQRAFFNFNLLAGLDRGLTVAATADKTTVNGGETVQLGATPSGGDPAYRYTWTSSCGGSFNNANAQNPVFTAPTNLTVQTDCLLTVELRDSCDRFAVDAVAIKVGPPISNLTIKKSVDVGTTTPVVAGQTLTYTLTFTKTGAAAQQLNHVDDLAGVVDDATVNKSSLVVTKSWGNAGNATAAFNTAGDRLTISGNMPEPGTLTVTFTVTVKADGQRGDSNLGNFLMKSGETPPTMCPPESETCTTNPVSSWTASKTAAPATGAWVDPGQTVTYRVTATSSQGDIADVILTDDLSGVLGHATFVADSATLTIDGGTPIAVDDPAGNSLVTDKFDLPDGKAAVLSYRVKVNDDARLDILENSAHGTATHTVNPNDPNPTTQDFPPTSCTAEVPCSTEHKVTAPIFIEKWSAKDAAALDGSAFDVRRDDNGAPADPDPDHPIMVTPVQGQTGLFSTSPLIPGETYWLIETKAPTGHSLLAQPVAFVLDAQGAVTIHHNVLNPQATVVSGAEDTIRVTDVAAIPLPLSGGLGVNLLAFGLLLAAAAGAITWVIRRQLVSTPAAAPVSE